MLGCWLTVQGLGIFKMLMCKTRPLRRPLMLFVSSPVNLLRAIFRSVETLYYSRSGRRINLCYKSGCRPGQEKSTQNYNLRTVLLNLGKPKPAVKVVLCVRAASAGRREENFGRTAFDLRSNGRQSKFEIQSGICKQNILRAHVRGQESPEGIGGGRNPKLKFSTSARTRNFSFRDARVDSPHFSLQRAE